MPDAASPHGILLLALHSAITRLHERCHAHGEEAARQLRRGDERLASAEGAVAFALAELASALRQAASDVSALAQTARSLPKPAAEHGATMPVQRPNDAHRAGRVHDVRLPDELDEDTRQLVCRFAEALAHQMVWRQQLERSREAWQDSSRVPAYIAQLQSAALDSHPLEAAELAAYLWHHGVISLRP
jgi:hypothetical protein